MSEKPLLSFLGLAARAGKLVYGQAQCTSAIRERRIQLLLLDGSVSDRTLKSFTDSCKTYNVPWIHLTGRDVLGPSVGKPDCRLVGIADAGFARSIMEKTGISPERERIE